MDGREVDGRRPDGKTLAFEQRTPLGNYDILTLSLEAPGAPSVLLGSRFDEIQLRFSPDGHTVAFLTDESGRYEVYVAPFPAMTPKLRVSAGGGRSPPWNPAGRELFYLANDGHLVAVPIRTTRCSSSERRQRSSPCPSGRRGATSRCRLTDTGFSPLPTRVAVPSNRSPSSSIDLQRPRGADLRQRDSGLTLSPLQSTRALRLHRPLRGWHAVHRLCARPACARTGAQQRPWCEVHRGPASGAAGVSGGVPVCGEGVGARDVVKQLTRAQKDALVVSGRRRRH